MVKKRKIERRLFTVHNRKYCWTKKQLKSELGMPMKDLNLIWKSGKKCK